jgi:hypothetical protein
MRLLSVRSALLEKTEQQVSNSKVIGLGFADDGIHVAPAGLVSRLIVDPAMNRRAILSSACGATVDPKNGWGSKLETNSLTS